VRRRLLNAYCVLSLLACVAVCALWVHSYQASIRIRWNSIVLEPTSRFRTDSIVSAHGRIGCTREDIRLLDDRPAYDLFRTPAREFLVTGPGDALSLAWGTFQSAVADSQATLTQLQFLGFCLIASENPNPDAPSAWRLGVWLPYWFIASALATPAALRLLVRLRRRRRFGAGLCHHCGYDLRATPDRCPECGAHPCGR
jgi:hypothetical protein